MSAVARRLAVVAAASAAIWASGALFVLDLLT